EQVGIAAGDAPQRFCLRHRLLPSLVGRPPRPECRVPSLRRRYPASTVLRTRPSLRLALVLGSSGVCPLEVSLRIEATGSHVPHKSLSLVSRRLHAGRRSASRQASAELCRRPTTGAWFWRRPYAFDTSATVHSRSSDQRTPDGIDPAFCRNAHHPGHWTDAACGGLDPDPAIRARGADPHLLCSKAARSCSTSHPPRAVVAHSRRPALSHPEWRSTQTRDKLPLVAQARHLGLISRSPYDGPASGLSAAARLCPMLAKRSSPAISTISGRRNQIARPQRIG